MEEDTNPVCTACGVPSTELNDEEECPLCSEESGDEIQETSVSS